MTPERGYIFNRNNFLTATALLGTCAVSAFIPLIAAEPEAANISKTAPVEAAPAPKPAAVSERKVTQPASEYYYISAKKLELNGPEAVRDAMAIYRMALHNGATNRAKEEAYLGLGRCEYRLGNYWRSFKAIESSFPQEFDSTQTNLRSRMEMILGGLLEQLGNNPVKGSAEDGEKELSGYQAAALVYQAVNYNDPKSGFAREALRSKGRCLLKSGEYDEAEKAYYTLLNSYPGSKEALEAGPELVELKALKSKNEGGLRGKTLDDAVNILRQAETMPDTNEAFKEKIGKAKTAVQENVAETKLKEAKYYLKRGGKKSEVAARFILSDIIKLYPQTKAGKEAEELFTKYYGKNGGR